MTSTLYPHQSAAVSWLINRPRALLFDEQGLGKTITAIAAADAVGAKKVLVVCPTVVLWNWRREFETWSPTRRIQVIDSGPTTFDDSADVVIVTHGLLIRPYIHAQIVARWWDQTILDEGHMFRNPDAKRVRAFYGRHGRHDETVVSASGSVVILTGTPMPNNASELWTHLHGLFPDSIKGKDSKPMSFAAFRSHYCLSRPTPYGLKITGNRNIHELRLMLTPVALRRLKKDVLDLPAIRFETITLRPKQVPWEIAELATEVGALLDDGATADEGFAALRASTEFARFRRLCGMAKTDPVIDLLRAELAFGALTKVVVFAHHVAVVDGIAHGLAEYNPVVITGATPPATRATLVDEFQNDPDIRVAVLNIVAGGTGITLTAAADVVFAEMSFVPGENAQAADRCHRIGQTERVRVRCVALAGTIDENIVEVLRTKTKMIREVIG